MSKGPEHGKGRDNGKPGLATFLRPVSLPSQGSVGASGFGFEVISWEKKKVKNVNLGAPVDPDTFIENDNTSKTPFPHSSTVQEMHIEHLL